MLNRLQIFGNFWNLTFVGGGLLERGTFQNFLLRGEGLISGGRLNGERGLIEFLR